MSKKPLVSVVMPVYNGEPYLKKAIDSILNQTFNDFEFIIINDGSTDSSQDIINGYTDERIVTASHPNMGVAGTLKKGLGLTKGQYICRMDSDDVADPERLARQKVYLDSNPDVGVVGSSSLMATVEGEIDGLVSYPLTDQQIQWFLLFDNPMIHSSIMFRKQIYETCGGYMESKEYSCTEDYELWSRMARHTKLSNIGKPLITRVELADGMCLANRQTQSDQASLISGDNCRFFISDDLLLRDSDIAILRATWLVIKLSPEISLLAVLKRILILRKAIRLLFEAVYKNCSDSQKLTAKRWLAHEYLEKLWSGPVSVIPIRLAFIISFEPIRLLSLRFYFRMLLGFTRRVFDKFQTSLNFFHPQNDS